MEIYRGNYVGFEHQYFLLRLSQSLITKVFLMTIFYNPFACLLYLHKINRELDKNGARDGWFVMRKGRTSCTPLQRITVFCQRRLDPGGLMGLGDDGGLVAAR